MKLLDGLLEQMDVSGCRLNLTDIVVEDRI